MCLINETRVMFLTNKVRVRFMIGVFLTKTIFQIKNKNNVGEYQFHFCVCVMLRWLMLMGKVGEKTLEVLKLP